MPPPIGLPGMDLPPGLTPQEQQAAEVRRREQLRAFKDAAPEVVGPPLPKAFGGPLAPASPGLPPAPAPAPGVPVPPGDGLSTADEAQWGGAGTQKQAGGYAASGTTPWEGAGTQTFKPQEPLPQPLANPKPAGISAEARQVLDAQDEKRQGALLGDIQKFQGYQKANLAAAESQASGQGGPPLPMMPALDTIGASDPGGSFPDVANRYRGLELLRSFGVAGTSQAASDAYAREKNAEKQQGFQDRRGKLLQESTGALSPLQQQDLRRRYNQLGLEESQAPDVPPALHINTLAGDQPGRYAMPSADRSRFVTPGTPEFEEAQRAGTARSALAQALHDTPAWLKLEEARMHVQAQQAAEHKTTIERWWAAHPQGTAPQFESFLATLQASDTLRREKGGGGNQEPGLPGPGQQGGPMGPPGPPEPGLPGAGGLTPGQAQLKSARDKAAQVDIVTPDEARLKLLYDKLPNLTDPEQLIEELAGQSLAMKHEPSRREIVKLIQQQGGKGNLRLVPKLEELLMRHADLGGLSAGRDWSDVEGVPVRSFQDTGVFRKQVQSPYGGVQGERYGNFLVGPLARVLTGQGPLVEPTSKDQMAGHAGKARASALLLRALYEGGYQR